MTGAKSGYHTLYCEVCQKETWHYYKHGLGKCTVHQSNLASTTAIKNEAVVKPTEKVFISEKQDESKYVPYSHDTYKKPKKENKIFLYDECPKGFHLVECQKCAKVTTHYKGEGDKEKPSCTICNHERVANMRHNVIPVDETKRPPTEGEFRRMNKLGPMMYRNSEARKARLPLPKHLDYLRDEIRTEKPVVDVNNVFCTFCKKQTSRISATTEKLPHIKKQTEVVKLGDGTTEIREKTVVTIEEIIACPKCSDKVRKSVEVRTV